MSASQIIIPLCRHIKTNGLRCQSPALAGQSFCFFHQRLHGDHPAPLTAQKIVNSWSEGMAEAMISAGDDPMQVARAYPMQNEFNFPLLEDAESIQFAASMLFHAIAQGHIHLRRARILLSVLHIANSSHRRADPPLQDPSALVSRVDLTPDGLALAPAGPEHSLQTGANPQLSQDAPSLPSGISPGLEVTPNSIN